MSNLLSMVGIIIFITLFFALIIIAIDGTSAFTEWMQNKLTFTKREKIQLSEPRNNASIKLK